MKRRRIDAGFSLIELLVVISIVALLVALLLPALGKAKQVAQIVNCGSKQHQTGLAIHMYANDNEQIVPISHADPTRIGKKDGNGIPTGLRVLYTGGYADFITFYCPTTLSGWKSHAKREAWDVTYDASGEPQYSNLQVSYAYIAGRAMFRYGVGGSYLSPLHDEYHVNRSIDEPSTRVMMYDHNEIYGGNQLFKTNHTAFNGKGIVDTPPLGFNFLFADGHVQWGGINNQDYRGLNNIWVGDIWIKSQKAIYMR